jgi:hypothetical protein
MNKIDYPGKLERLGSRMIAQRDALSSLRIVIQDIIHDKKEKKKYFDADAAFSVGELKNKERNRQKIKPHSGVKEPRQRREGQFDGAAYKTEKQGINAEKKGITPGIIAEKRDIHKNG